MAIPHLHRLARALSFAALAGAAGCTLYPSTPADPVFETDVRPIFLAHCTRCHGNGPDGGSLNMAAGSQDTGETPLSCLTQYGVNNNVPANTTACHYGANFAATEQGSIGNIHTNIHSNDPTLEMPPPPAPRLNSYELGVVDNWLNESPRKCSDSPSPDPALFCPDGGT